MKRFKGIVTTGTNRASKHLKGPDGIHLRTITGVLFYPGTLNITLNKPLLFKNYIVLEHHVYFVNRYQILVPALLNKTSVWLAKGVKKPMEDRTKLKRIEVLSEHRLRDAFSLKDGSNVNIEVETKYCRELFSCIHPTNYLLPALPGLHSFAVKNS